MALFDMLIGFFFIKVTNILVFMVKLIFFLKKRDIIKHILGVH